MIREGFDSKGITYIDVIGFLHQSGGWLGLLKGNAAKLARVVINYPNNADSNVEGKW